MACASHNKRIKFFGISLFVKPGCNFTMHAVHIESKHWFFFAKYLLCVNIRLWYTVTSRYKYKKLNSYHDTIVNYFVNVEYVYAIL